MLSFHTHVTWLILTQAILVGCANQQSPLFKNSVLNDIENTAPSQTDEEFLTSIENLRDQSEELNLSNNMYRRNMSLNYDSDVNHLTGHQQKVIKLFFQTLPETKNISIILSIAPSSFGSGFESLNSAWIRVQELKNHLENYSKKIEELYIPDQEADTVNIQILGGDGV